mmetsp:Transcript_141183/g.451286  ORF Transcript_141183/g.451286 Transcript_141183/m.451286 type:complete len:226 (-) Transcript_141183:728-1405(-)
MRRDTGGGRAYPASRLRGPPVARCPGPPAVVRRAPRPSPDEGSPQDSREGRRGGSALPRRKRQPPGSQTSPPASAILWSFFGLFGLFSLSLLRGARDGQCFGHTHCAGAAPACCDRPAFPRQRASLQEGGALSQLLAAGGAPGAWDGSPEGGNTHSFQFSFNLTLEPEGSISRFGMAEMPSSMMVTSVVMDCIRLKPARSPMLTQPSWSIRARRKRSRIRFSCPK